jgi:threonine dehydrogenase-like Zn-dependent dehydrogenase
VVEKNMLGAVFEGDGKLSLKELAVPEIKNPNEVLVKVEACGICGSDMSILAVPPAHPANLNTILGHEFVGHVAEAGKDVTHVKPGDRVAIAPNLSCGVCPYCLVGMYNQCLNWEALGIHRNGGFAEYALAPVSQVLPLSSDLPIEEALFIEPLSCVYAGTSRINIQPGETAVVLGAGPIGLIFMKIFKASGAGKVIETEIAPFRLEFARKSGADIAVNPNEQDLEEIVFGETGIGANVVVDAVGSLADQATLVAAKKARVCLFGVDTNANPPLEQWRITHNELEIFGTFIGVSMFAHAIRILESGVLSLSGLLTGRYPLSEIHKGIESIKAGNAVKIMITP